MKLSSAAVLLSLTLTSVTASADAQFPTVQQLSDLRLHDGFTLIYQVTVRDVRTAALRASDVGDARAGNAKEVLRQHYSKSVADQMEVQAAFLGRLRQDEHFTVTLSARDGKLLYLSTRGGARLKDGSTQAIILDGEKEYEANDPMSAMINNDTWQTAPVYRDENVDRLAFYPLPGVGLPGVDSIQQPIRAGVTADGHAHFRGLVPLINIVGADPPYKIGEVDSVSMGGHLRIVSLLVGAPAVPLEHWKISTFRLFQEHWIGTQMQMIQYQGASAFDTDVITSNLPTCVADYVLTEARPAALNASAFAAETYLAKGARVFDDSTGNSVLFTYDPNVGSLKEQDQTERKKVSENTHQTP
jgi:hypothetical protein